jgi:septum formation protein
LEVATRFPNRIVLGADTVVSLEGKTYGKPKDLEEAKSMLEQLCGRVHEVLTGVCLIHRDNQKMCRFVESTRVKFRPLNAVNLDEYLATVHTLDKAGAYAAQDDNGRLIECIEGSMSNVVGLPVEAVLVALEKHFPDQAK